MSLSRLVAGIAIIIAILPSDVEKQQALHKAAMSVGNEARSFCASRPNVCLSKGEIWDAMKSKAAFGYGLASELVWGQDRTFQRRNAVARIQRNDTIGTLLSSDLGDL